MKRDRVAEVLDFYQRGFATTVSQSVQYILQCWHYCTGIYDKWTLHEIIASRCVDTRSNVSRCYWEICVKGWLKVSTGMPQSKSWLKQ